MGIAILKDGKVVVALAGAKTSEVEDHIRNGYPQYIPDLPSLVAVEHPDDALPQVDPPALPAVPAVDVEAMERESIISGSDAILLDIENRLRALEGREAGTKADLLSVVAASKGKLLGAPASM